jgi:hypothetical protein
MQIKAIDFKALWQMIETHGNQNEWKSFESFPVPVQCLEPSTIHPVMGQTWKRTYGYLILRIRLRASVKGGVCRFEVETKSKPISLAKYFQSNDWKHKESKLAGFSIDLESALISCDKIDDQTNGFRYADANRTMLTMAYRSNVTRQTKKYLNAMGRLTDYTKREAELKQIIDLTLG